MCVIIAQNCNPALTCCCHFYRGDIRLYGELTQLHLRASTSKPAAAPGNHGAQQLQH